MAGPSPSRRQAVEADAAPAAGTFAGPTVNAGLPETTVTAGQASSETATSKQAFAATASPEPAKATNAQADGSYAETGLSPETAAAR